MVDQNPRTGADSCVRDHAETGGDYEYEGAATGLAESIQENGGEHRGADWTFNLIVCRRQSPGRVLSLAVTDFLGYIRTGEALNHLLYHLTALSEYDRGRFAILNGAQRACIREVLLFLRENYYDYIGDSELDQAIEGYWSS